MTVDEERAIRERFGVDYLLPKKVYSQAEYDKLRARVEQLEQAASKALAWFESVEPSIKEIDLIRAELRAALEQK